MIFSGLDIRSTSIDLHKDRKIGIGGCNLQFVAVGVENIQSFANVFYSYATDHIFVYGNGRQRVGHLEYQNWTEGFYLHLKPTTLRIFNIAMLKTIFDEGDKQHGFNHKLIVAIVGLDLDIEIGICLKLLKIDKVVNVLNLSLQLHLFALAVVECEAKHIGEFENHIGRTGTLDNGECVDIIECVEEKMWVNLALEELHLELNVLVREVNLPFLTIELAIVEAIEGANEEHGHNGEQIFEGEYVTLERDWHHLELAPRRESLHNKKGNQHKDQHANGIEEIFAPKEVARQKQMQIDVEGGDADQESFKEKGQETNVALNELRGGQHKNKDHNQNDFEKQIALYLDLRHREERLMAEWKT